jgi:hypothetical protein
VVTTADDGQPTRRGLDQRVKHPLHIEGRPADDFQNFSRGRLLFQGFLQLALAGLLRLEQACVLRDWVGTMPSESSMSGADQVRRRTAEELERELAEAREQQVATAEILKVISSTPRTWNACSQRSRRARPAFVMRMTR